MPNDKKFISEFSNLVYCHEVNQNKKMIFMLHCIIVSCDQTPVEIDNPDQEVKGSLPQGWDKEEKDGIYCFKYKKDKDILTVKTITLGQKISINLFSSKDTDNLITEEIDVSRLKGTSLIQDYQDVLSMLKGEVMDHIDPKPKKSPGLFDLKPKIIDSGVQNPDPGYLRNNPYFNNPNRRDIWNPSPLHPEFGGGEQVGPEHPYFRRGNRMNIRGDPPFPFPEQGFGGGFGGPGGNFPPFNG